MQIQLIRHATLLIEYADMRLLVDPMLNDAGAGPPIQNSPNPRNNPLVNLPMPAGDVINDVTAILVTQVLIGWWLRVARPKKLPI